MLGEFLNVLLVEDETPNINAWKDAVETHNVDVDQKGFSIKWNSAASLIEAREKLATTRYDAVIVDLRLRNSAAGAGHNDDGNELIKELIATKPVGIVVYSGQSAEAESYACNQVVVIDRAAGLPPVFEWLTEHKNMFISLGRAQLELDEQTAQLFYKAIWPRWKFWASEKNTEYPIEKMLARHIASHTHDSLLNDSNGITHPEESYFVPPIIERLDTGDLIEWDSNVWVVVTPRCDLAHENKTDTILIAKCNDRSTDWNSFVQNNKEKEIKKLKQHESSSKQHFLAPMKDAFGATRGPWMVQFHHLRSLPIDEAKIQLTERFATISPHFVPSLVERFGAHYSRIGTPDISE